MKSILRQRRSRARGFTLTELMVSLVMGLIVALAAVGLARTATTTFHEQARSSQTEMSIRTASERLKLDLMRASYMSTGNIALDPKVARLANASTPLQIARYASITNLRGVQIDPNMANTGTAPAGVTANGFFPDSIDLVGNFTTDDSYAGVVTMGSGGISGTSCAVAQAITLDPNSDAAVYNLGGGTSTATYTAAALLANATAAFLPYGITHPMLAQVTDQNGCANYVPVCGVGLNGAGNLVIDVDGVSNIRAVLYSNSPDYEQANGGLLGQCGASENGKVSIAPLQKVRWTLQVTNAALATDPTWLEDDKTDLVRQVYDFNNAAVGPPEVIAEYAVDLKFGILYDDRTATTINRQHYDDLDSDIGGGDIYNVTQSSDSLLTTKNGPQRVRAVKYRIAVRTAVADREQDLATGAPYFRARYCVAASGGLTNCVKWSRVRTVVSEVGLTNQARMNY